MDPLDLEQVRRVDAVILATEDRYRKFNAQVAALFPQGMTSLELSVLQCVHRQPQVILSDISRRLQVRPSTLTSVIDRLESRGLVRRTIRSDNRRAFGLELTDAGRDAEHVHQESEERLWSRILSTLETKDEREQLLTLVEKVLKGLADQETQE